MSVFAVTFRIADAKTNYGTYDTRYDSVVEVLKGISPSIYWDETTSFFLIEDDGDAEALVEAIDANSSFDAGHDILVVIDLSHTDHAVIGQYKDSDIHKIMSRR